MKKFVLMMIMLLITAFTNHGFVSIKAETTHAPLPTTIEKKSKDVVKVKNGELYEDLNNLKVLYRNVMGTVYHPVQSQTDNTPHMTGDGSKIDTARVNQLRWIAVSRDLIHLKTSRYNFNGLLKFGDTVWIDYDRNHAIAMAKSQRFSKERTEHMLKMYEKVKGWWVVKDTMGDYGWVPVKDASPDSIDLTSKEYKVKDGKLYKKHYQRNWIDFLQHPKTGMLHTWRKSLIIAKKKVSSNKLSHNSM